MRLILSLLLGLGLSWTVLGRAKNVFADEKLERWESRLLAGYQRKIEALLADAETGCVDCHSSGSMSNLVLSGRPLQDFRFLLDNGYLNREGPDTLLGRLTSENEDRRMPKDGKSWDKAKIHKLKHFLELVARQQVVTGAAADERFPRSLLSAFPSDSSGRAPTQFISYRQLKAKVAAIFHDDWVRGDRDLFAEYVSAFGGADFETRFNESTEPSAGYLSALEVMSRDVASRAFRRRSGPFSDWHEPDHGDEAALQRSIRSVYEQILFRAPSEQESAKALELLRGIEALDHAVSERDTKLVFEVTVLDPTTELSASRTVTIPVSGDRLGVQQSILDQRPERIEPDRWLEQIVGRLTKRISDRIRSVDPSDGDGRKSLGVVSLGDRQPARVVLHNLGTQRNVSFGGIAIRTLSGEVVETIDADSSNLQVEGAWTLQNRRGQKTLEDENQHKGMSTITVPLSATKPGEYEIIAKWKPAPDNAHNVLVELYGHHEPSRLASERPVLGSKGKSRFYYDCGNDSIPYFELPASFQFAPEDFVEISNAGTHQRVTAGAVDMINAKDPPNNFLIDSKIAEGVDQWEKYNEGTFGAYNVRGLKVHDENKRKGQLTLKYRLRDRVDHGWRQDEFYRVRVYYPGKRNHEPRVPVTVHAQRSSPIIQIAYPLIGKSDATVTLDASPSYTVQHSELEFRWRQVSGPRVNVDDWSTSAISFDAPRQSGRELAWVSLCSALMRHPDFLFTQPPTVESANDQLNERLKLSKVAMDLVGRPPTKEELAKFSSGASLESLVNGYLDSDDFRDDYFHRIRLYLESQGSETQDEPARLWSYIALNDRPFQEILTADYTVDTNFQKVNRPEHHGRTGVLTTKGFIEGKPGLPHYNYAAQVSMLFLGYVYEVPPEIVEQREGVTALGTTDPNSTCYSCHKILTPLAFQRLNWTDDGEFRTKDEDGLDIDASDREAVSEYPFAGRGLEAFATQAVKKERFIRTIINTHVDFYFGRPMRHLEEERGLYKRLWDSVHENKFQLRALIREIVTSPEYLSGVSQETSPTLSATNNSATTANTSRNSGDES